MTKTTIYCLMFLFSYSYSTAQNLSGKVTETNGEPVIGANLVIKGTGLGTTTDVDGTFSLNTKGQKLPFMLEVSFIGYTTKTVEVTRLEKLVLTLEPDQEMLSEVSIVEQRLSEKQRKSALTVEALDALAIKETPAANFYEALGNLKGVDLTSASIGFKIINTRGFNSTSPVRSLQIIDGVDNQAPGLNFSLGNFLGASELDIANVDIIAGASTAFYGPGAFNGVIAMTTKDPFLYQGISASVKVGERALTETAVRYAEAFKIGGVDYDNFAFKVNLFYLRANDWEATNYNPVYGSPVAADNPGGIDAINIYGDESLESNNEYNTYGDVVSGKPGLGIFYRPGYKEVDLVDYNTQNFKGNVGLFYKFKNDVQVGYNFNYGTGTTVYQGENRFSLKDIQFWQNTLEVKKKDQFFVRAYTTQEDAGNSYDAVLTAFKMNDIIYGDEKSYNSDYAARWSGAPFRFARSFQQAAGFDVNSPSFDSAFYNNEYQSLLREYNSLLTDFHDSLRNIQNQSYQRPLAGSAEYDSLFNYVTGRTFTNGGSKFYDRSALYHIMGEYQFHPSWADVRLGANFRWYRPNSRGNIFDEVIPGSIVVDSVTGNIISQEYRTIKNQEYGAYVGFERKFISDLLKASVTLRMDKNQNFDYLFSPAASLVYTIDEKNTVRLSAGRAIRNPTLQDQYLRYDVGRAVLLGNINGYNDLVSIKSFDFYRSQAQLNRDNLDFFDVAPIEPERVTTVEAGYRGSLLKRFFLDVNYFYSWYNNFIGYQFGLDLEFDEQVTDRVTSLRAYRVAANAPELVTTQGISIGLNYYINDYLTLNNNYSWNKLNLRESDNPIIPAFNTPENKFNIGLVGRGYKLKKESKNTLGFAATYKWVQGFLFEGSPQFTGFIESYGMLDAQVSYTVPKWYTTFKLGASNVLNNKVFQVYGGPSIGRMAYFSIVFEKF